MTTVIGVLSTVFVVLMLSTGIPNIKEYNNINVSGEKIFVNKNDNEDIININNFYRIETEEYAVRGEDTDLISEYSFLRNIAKQNDLDIRHQTRVYISEYKGQKSDKYSKFQENDIIYRFKDNGDFRVEIKFSENEILDEWKENENKTFLESTIENEKVHIFEWKIPNDDYQNNFRAQFEINGINFIIKIINASHDECIKIIKTTIKEYKNFEKEKKEAGCMLKPTEKEIIAMYEKAQEIYLWFIGNIPYEKFDYKNAIKDGIYPIKDERFSDIEELKEYLNHIFTKKSMEQLIEKIDKADLFFEINKKLYAKEYSLAKSIYSGEEVIKDIKYIDDNIIVITVLAEILDEDLINIKEQEEHNFKLIYDSGEWKFSEFYCIGF